MTNCYFQPWFIKILYKRNHERLMKIRLPIVSTKHIQGIIPCNKSMLAASGNTKRWGAKMHFFPNDNLQYTCTYFYYLKWATIHCDHLWQSRHDVLFRSPLTMWPFDLLLWSQQTKTNTKGDCKRLMSYHRRGNLVNGKTISLW